VLFDTTLKVPNCFGVHAVADVEIPAFDLAEARIAVAEAHEVDVARAQDHA
jgi:hypothetical protein